MQIKEFVTCFQGVKPNGNGYIARCPGHDDRSPSLGINVAEDGRMLVICHAGCTTDDVLQAVDLEMADLFNDNGTLGQSKRPAGRPRSKPGPEPIDPQLIEHMHQELPKKTRDY